ncbi:MAG TPA: magnesium/cobalt transporter CorA [Rubrobacteraceae bacterium]|jgi:magnesium transporter|nr:magnesium/cobalt transporter CorA [Rubrobacteraceae bacterium]
MIVDSAVYVDGKRVVVSDSLEGVYETYREKDGFAWIGLYEPTKDEFDSVAGEFGLHPLAVRDALRAHQRPKVERYGETLFVVIKAARYVEEKEVVEFGEVHAFVGPDFVVTVRYGETNQLEKVRRSLEGRPDLLRKGPYAVLYAIMDRIVDDYVPVVDGLANDIDEIEVEVFENKPDVSKRIYELSREVIRFHQATQPLAGTLESLTQEETSDIDREVRGYLRDVQDRVLRVTDQAQGFRELLQNILSVNLTLASVNQNDQVKKISAWAAILIVPTLITGIYGMNFDSMPELHWTYGYPLALLLMLTISLILYWGFKRRGWL